MSKYDIRPNLEWKKNEKWKAKNEKRIANNEKWKTNTKKTKRENIKRKMNNKNEKRKTNQLHHAQDYCSVYEKCRYGKCSKSSNTNLLLLIPLFVIL